MSGCASTPKNPWSEVRLPTKGPSKIVGGYSAGCLSGAGSILPDGPGFQMMRLSRGKFYGHPTLLRFIGGLGAAIEKRKLGQILIGNLGQARGGPSFVGHKSHQTGLDVDLWYWQPLRLNQDQQLKRLTLAEREAFESPSVVASNGIALNFGIWNTGIEKILRLVAEDQSVDRVFVNAVVKKHLCSKYAGQDWLSKIRPWWKHDDHFHVRLKCPQDQPSCIAQEPVPPSDGCNADLDWWFSDEARTQAKVTENEPVKYVLPKLPDECAGILNQ